MNALRKSAAARSVMLIAFLLPAAPADGGKAKKVIYDGQARPHSGNGTWQFTIDISPIIFYLGTVNKIRLWEV